MRFGRIFIVLVFILSCFDSLGQKSLSISGNYQNTSVAKVLLDISNRYDILFAYDSYVLNGIEGSWAFDETELDDVLVILLQGQDLTYEWKDETVVIYWVQNPQFSGFNELSDKEDIIGEVRDASSRELLPFAVLSFRMQQTNVICDADGAFHLFGPENVQSIQDTVDVYFVGYELLSVPASQFSGSGKVVLFLQPNRNYLPDVLVTAVQVKKLQHAERPSTYILNPNDISIADGIGEKDLLRTVQLLPGVSATQETNNGVFIRGSNSDQTMMSLDGFTIYHQDHFFGTFTAVNANAVKSMRIMKGAMDTRYGGRSAGILEMIGREGNLRKSHAQIDIGTLSVGAVVESPMDTAGKASVFFAGRRAITDVLISPGYKSLFDNVYNTAIVTDRANNNSAFSGSTSPDFYFQDANLKFTYRPSTDNAINVSCYVSKDQLAIQYADTLNVENTNARDIFYSDESVKKNTGGSIRWTRRVNPHWESLLSLGFSEFQGNYFSADTIRELLFQTDSSNFSFENNALRDLNFHADFTGFYRRNEISTGVQINRMNTKRKYNSQGNVVDHQPVSETVYTIYGGDKLIVSPVFSVQTGMRLNFYTGTNRFYPEPRLIAAFKPWGAHFDFKFGASRTTQFIQRVQNQNLYLNTPDYWQLAGNNELDVLRSDQLTLGFLWDRNHWVIDFEIYHKWNEGNAFIPGPYARSMNAGDQISTVVSGHGIAKGCDLSIEKEFGIHHFIFSYSNLHAFGEYDQLEQNVVTEVFDQRHELKLTYQLTWNRWSLGLFAVYGSGRPYTPLLGTYQITLLNGRQFFMPLFGDLNSARLPDYHRVDFTMMYEFRIGKAKAQIIGSVYNVYNQRNIRDVQYLSIAQGSDNDDYMIASRQLQMIGFLPSINFRLNF